MAGYEMAAEQYLPYMTQMAPETPGSYYSVLTQGNPRLLQAIYAPGTKYAGDVKAKGKVAGDVVSAGSRSAMEALDEMGKEPSVHMAGRVAVGLRKSPMQAIAKGIVAGADTLRAHKQDDATREAEAEAAEKMGKGMRKEYERYQGLRREQSNYATAKNIAIADREALDELDKKEQEVWQPLDDLMGLGGIAIDRETGKTVAGKGSVLEGGDQRAMFRTIANKWGIDTKKLASYGSGVEQAEYLLANIPNRRAVSQAMGQRYLIDNGYSPLDARRIAQSDPSIGEMALEEFGQVLLGALAPKEPEPKEPASTKQQGSGVLPELGGMDWTRGMRPKGY